MASCSLTGGLPEFETQLPELSAKFVFVVPVSIMLGFLSLPLHWDSFAFSFYHVSFHQVGLLLCLVSTLLGPSWDCSSQVKSTTRHQICQGVCNFLGSVSPQQSFEIVDQCYSLVTAQFYSASKGKYALEAWRRPASNETQLLMLPVWWHDPKYCSLAFMWDAKRNLLYWYT